MRSLRAAWRRVLGFLSPARGERDFADEMQSHLDHHVDDNLRAGMTPLIANQLFGISAADPAPIATVVTALLAVAIVAAASPAARVLRVDPVSTLRCD